MYEQVIFAILAAITYALAGYLKKQPRPSFSKQQLVLTILLGVIVGLIQFYTKLEYDVVYGYLLSFGIVAVLESAIKLAWRKLSQFGWMENH